MYILKINKYYGYYEYAPSIFKIITGICIDLDDKTIDFLINLFLIFGYYNKTFFRFTDYLSYIRNIINDSTYNLWHDTYYSDYKYSIRYCEKIKKMNAIISLINNI